VAETITRRLAAIVSADVAGYSRLMALDEVGTVRRLTEYREVISKLAKEYGGRVVDNPGDNALLEFPSATSAVECAIAIQDEIRKRNAAAEQPMELRIGAHVGEVMVEGNRIYGDGVNLAARLEAIAPVGGICVSKAIRDQIASKVAARFDDMGLHDLKNIPEPVHVFRVGKQERHVVVAAAVAGLDNLLGDVEGALSTLKAHRTATNPIVLSHGGRVTEATQDRIIYEFPSALEAVRCGSEVQALMAGRNATVPPERRMQYQLGIHDGDDSDAVSTSIRIQETSEPGGMSLSETIYERVVSETPLQLVPAGRLDGGLNVWKVDAPTADHAEEAQTGPGVLLVLPSTASAVTPNRPISWTGSPTTSSPL
jgi:class 3 adenylate cyclase